MSLILKTNPETNVVLYLEASGDDIDLYASVGGREILIAYFHNKKLELVHCDNTERSLLEENLDFENDRIVVAKR